YQYNQLGYLTQILDGEHRVQQFKRDALGRLLEKTSLNSLTRHSDTSHFGYDNEGRLLFANNAARKLKFAYDAAGQLTDEWQDKEHLKHEYDELGRKVLSILPDGEIIHYQYHHTNQLERITFNDQVISQYERDNTGRLHAINHGNGLYTSQQYDSLGKLTNQMLQQQDKTLAQRQYQYHPQGTIAAIETLQGKTTFEYDQNEQLKSVAGLINQQFAFDPAGNIEAVSSKTSETKPSTIPAQQPPINSFRGETDKSQTPVYKNAGNRLEAYQNFKYQYDDSGNCTLIKQLQIREDGSKDKPINTRLEYDGANQLISASHQGQSIAYEYDALGRRVTKNTGKAITRFLWNGDV
ncbi:hypothetical protein ABVT43_20980, partial [Aliikangiella sp. GXAS 311]